MKRLTWHQWLALLNLPAWAYFAFLVFFQGPYLSYVGMPFGLESPDGIVHEGVRVVLRPGDDVPLLVHRCNADSTPHVYTSSRTIDRLDVPQASIAIQATPITALPGCTTTRSRLTRIPMDTPPGIYFLHGDAEVSGLLRTVVVSWHSAPFEVRK